MKMLTEEELTQRAIRAYSSRLLCELGVTAQYPSNASGIEKHGGKEYVVLRNVNGVLAVYEIRANETIRCVDEDNWPKQLQGETRD